MTMTTTMRTPSLSRQMQTMSEAGEQVNSPQDVLGLKEFVRSHSLPCFARIVRDARARRGSEKDADDGELYLHCLAAVSYVAADEMSVVHRKHIQPTSQRFYIPLDCRGWFEVLSQDGISARPFGSVMELSKLAPNTKCLVRQSIGGYVRKADGYDSQIVRKGDVLTVSETLWISTRSGGGGTFNKQLLRCVDQRAQEIFLDLNLRGMFSPIAGKTNVTGAQTIQSLLTKFRLPVMVRLLHGNINQGSASTYSTGVFKLISVFSDEILFAFPSKGRQDDRILPITTRAKTLKLRHVQKSRNDAIQSLGKYCKSMVSKYLDTILSVVAINESTWFLADVELEPIDYGPKEKKDRTATGNERKNSLPANPEEEELFREIEDIYNNIAGPNPVPRPIVFTTEPASRNKGLRRNITAVAKMKTVQYRPSSAAQKTRVIDDNWQMLPRQAANSTVHLKNSVDTSTPTNDAQVQTSPKAERHKRKPISNAIAIPRKKETKRHEHLYEEIPFFSKTNLSATSMDIQKTMYVSDTSISCSDSLPESPERDVTLTKSGKSREDVGLNIEHKLTKAVGLGKENHSRNSIDNNTEMLPRRKNQPRPKSVVGTFGEQLGESHVEILLDEPPPPLPPKRGESMCNLREDVQTLELRAVSNDDLSESPIPETSSTPDVGTISDDSPTLATSPTQAASSVERRQSSKVSSAVKTLGNVSRTFFNTFKRIGVRSTATLVINNNNTPDDPRQPRGAGSKESVAKSSTGSSPEPPLSQSDRPDMRESVSLSL